MRSTTRLTGAAKKTVERLLVSIGIHKTALRQRTRFVSRSAPPWHCFPPLSESWQLRQQWRQPLGHRLIQAHPVAVLENSQLTEWDSQIVVVENPDMRKFADGGLEVRQLIVLLSTENQVWRGT
jgi:hypothetical protein